MNCLKLISFILLLSTMLLVTVAITKRIPNSNDQQSQSMVEIIDNMSTPPCIKMYFSLIHYADMYNIPRKYAYAIAYAETRYKGPFHWDYNHMQTSHANALGPMQIMPSTANYIMKETISHTDLKTNIPLNVEISMKLLSKLKKRYGDWKIVFGYYNTGRPIVNNYAIKVFNEEYVWIKN